MDRFFLSVKIDAAESEICLKKMCIPLLMLEVANVSSCH